MMFGCTPIPHAELCAQCSERPLYQLLELLEPTNPGVQSWGRSLLVALHCAANSEDGQLILIGGQDRDQRQVDDGRTLEDGTAFSGAVIHPLLECFAADEITLKLLKAKLGTHKRAKNKRQPWLSQKR